MAEIKSMFACRDVVNGDMPEEERLARITTCQLVFLSKSVMPALCRHKYAWPFLEPVDPVRLNIPDYSIIIKAPMDFGTIKNRLKTNYYKSSKECIDDIKLVFSNCYTYNKAHEDIVVMAKVLEGIFQKKIENLPLDEAQISLVSKIHERKQLIIDDSVMVSKQCNGKPTQPVAGVCRPTAPETVQKVTLKKRNSSIISFRHESICSRATSICVSELCKSPSVKTGPLKNRSFRICKQILNALFSKKHSTYAWPFYEPIDTKYLNLDDYDKVIANPMDLSTVRQKLNDMQYNNAIEFAQDIRLIFENCYKYNTPNHDVYVMGKKLEDVFERQFSRVPLHDNSWINPIALCPPIKSLHDVEKNIKYIFKELLEVKLQNNKTMETVKIMQNQLRKRNTSTNTKKRSYRGEIISRKLKQKHKQPESKMGEELNQESPEVQIFQLNESDSNEEDIRELSYDMKRRLCSAMTKLTKDKLMHIVEIIKKAEPKLTFTYDSCKDVEIDLEQLKPSTIERINKYVTSSQRSRLPRNILMNKNIQQIQKELEDKLKFVTNKLEQNTTKRCRRQRTISRTKSISVGSCSRSSSSDSSDVSSTSMVNTNLPRTLSKTI